VGGLFAYLAAQAIRAIQRKATVYGLMAIGGLLVIFAAGYGLNAAFTMLAFRLGATIASLIVAGGLLALAAILVVAATILARRPVFSPTLAERSSPYSHAPYRAPYSRQRATAMGAGAAGAISAAVLVVRSKSMRNVLRGKRDTLDGSPQQHEDRQI
jgi:hypothetical protein